MATRHQRFALRDVTFAGLAMPGVVADRQPAEGRAELVVFQGTGDLAGLDDRAS